MTHLDGQWAQIALIEGVSDGAAPEPLGAWREQAVRRARGGLAPLHRWERISAGSYGTYQHEPNLVRLHRLLDFVHDGDRVLDVGFGYGYVTGVLLRERRLAGYCGIDLREGYVAAVEDMAWANALDLGACRLEIRDVREIDAIWVAGHRPDIVVVLEVLEHLEEPEAALTAIAHSVGEEVTVLFTVPILGHLDGVWGHVTVFDRHRIARMCRSAGLHIHHVEPVHAVWALVAASTGPVPPPRLEPIIANAPRLPEDLEPPPPPAELPSYTVTTLAFDARQRLRRPADDRGAVKVDPRRLGVTCEVTSGADAVTGGIRVPMVEPRMLRLDLTWTNPAAIEEIDVIAVDDAGAPVLRWNASARRRPIRPDRVTHVLRPGRMTSRFRAWGQGTDPSGARGLDVTVRVAPGATAGFVLHRAAYLGSRPAAGIEAA